MAPFKSPMISIPEEAKAIIKVLQLQNFKTKDSGLSYRSLNHYQTLGLIDLNKKNSKEWGKLSGLDLIWIRVMIHLREWGIALEKIALLKKNLFHYGTNGSVDKADFITSSFENEIALSLYNRYELFLLIFPDFSYTFQDSLSQKQWNLKPYRESASLCVPLSVAIKEVWKLAIQYKAVV